MTHDIDIASLTPAQRILLAEALWDSVAATQTAPPLTSAQREELERRMAAADRGEMKYSSWAEVKRRLLSGE